MAAVQVTPVPPSQSKSKHNQQNQQAQQVPQQSSHSNQQPISGRRGRDSISGEGSTELYFPKTKRAKVIVPEGVHFCIFIFIFMHVFSAWFANFKSLLSLQTDYQCTMLVHLLY